MSGPAPFFVLSRLTPEASVSSFDHTETTLGHAMLPATARPAGAVLNASLVARLSALPSGTATIRLRSQSIAGPILGSVVISAVSTPTEASVEFTAPLDVSSIFVTGQAENAVTCTISMFSVALSGLGAPILGPISSAPDPAPPELDQGIDFDCIDNFPKSFVLARGRKNLANAIARQLQTPEGFLALAFGGDPDYGYDLRGQLNMAQRLEVIAAIESRVKEKVERDERVQAAEVSAAYDLATSTLTVEITVEDAEGPFALVLKVSDVTTEVVLVSES